MDDKLIKKIKDVGKHKISLDRKNASVNIVPIEWKVEKLSNHILRMDSGISLNASDKPASRNEVGILKTSAVSSGCFIPTENKAIEVSSDYELKCSVKKDNILIVRKNTPDLVGKSCFVCKDYDNLFLPDLVWQTHFKEESRINRKWLFYVLNSRPYKNTFKRLASGTNESMVNITKETFLNIDLLVPTEYEQAKISEILSVWDSAIELKEKLIKEKKKQKSGLMQNLLTGKVRLSGFDEEWSNVKLKQVLNQRKEKSEISDGLELYSLTIEDGVTAKTNRYNREFLVKSSSKKYKISKQNDIVYNPANLRFGAIAVNKISVPVLLSPIYEVLYLRKDKPYSLNFVGQLLTWNRTISLFATMTEGTLVERMAVKVDTFLEVEFKMPSSVDEQNAIGLVLDLADKEVNYLEKEVEELKKQKTGLMQLLLTGIVRVNVEMN